MVLNNRVYLWDNLRLILMVLVMITHSIIPYQFLGERWVNVIWIFTMTFTMPAFAFVSGFLSKPHSLMHNVRMYLYPVVLFSFINTFVLLLTPLAKVIEPSFFQIGYTMWYLWSLFIYSIVVIPLVSRFGIRKVLMGGVLAFVFLNLVPFDNTRFQICRVINFMPFYMIGIFIRKNYPNLLYHWNSKYRKIAVIILITCFCIYAIGESRFPGLVYQTGLTSMITTQTSYFNLFVRLFTYAICLIMTFCLISIIPNRKYSWSRYGRNTMNAYMLHMVVIFILSWICLEPIRSSYVGIIGALIVVPAFCSLLFSDWLNIAMSIILLKNTEWRNRVIKG